MKKSILRSVFMALMALLWTANAQAEDYGFAIGHKQVTSENYTNISAEGGFSAVKSGAVIYDPLSKTLTLDNAVIEEEQQGAPISNNRVDGLNIVRVKGLQRAAYSAQRSLQL